MTEILDNRAHRIRALKHVIKHLHQGEAPEQVKAQLKALVRQTDASEIAAMEQELIGEGMTAGEVRSMCDLHAEVLREIMVEPPPRDLAPGHPVDTFRRENEALGEAVRRMRAALEEVRRRPQGTVPEDLLARLRRASSDLAEVDKHYQRKENLVFSCLEKYGITGPSKVMWAKDDEARQLLKRVGRILARKDLTAETLVELADTTAEPALQEIEGMIFKEENILLPMALQTLSEDDWGRIWHDSPTYGWCLVEARQGYRPPEPAAALPPARVAPEQAVELPAGHLTLEQLKGLFAALPVDLTFVDAEDRVRYFSEGPKRIFTRSKAILGRQVQHCHPPGSVHVVEQILSDFRRGLRDAAEFWIRFQGRFVHIRYFAVRGSGGNYLGTLEVTQDLTPLRALEGERRLLQYDAPGGPPAAG